MNLTLEKYEKISDKVTTAISAIEVLSDLGIDELESMQSFMEMAARNLKEAKEALESLVPPPRPGLAGEKVSHGYLG